jgi:hypothetical protein
LLSLGENREGAIEALMDLDARSRIRSPSGIRQDLQLVRAEGHRVVVLDGAQVFEAADGVEVAVGRQRAKGRPSFSGGAGEATIVAGDVGGEEGVGAGEVADAGEAQFTDQPILESTAHALHATFGLGRRGRDPLDAQFGQRAADLGGRRFTAELLLQREWRARSPFEDPVPVGVDSDGDPMRRDELAEQEEIARGILPLAEDGPEDHPGGIVNGVQEHESGAASLEPEVVAAVHLDEEAGAPHPLPALAVLRGATALGAAQACCPQEAVDGGVREDDRLVLREELGEMFVVDAGVGRPSERDDPSPDGRTYAAGRRAASVAMDEGLGATTTIGLPEPPEVADREADESRGGRHHHFTAVQGVENNQPLVGTLRQGDHASPLRMAGGRTFSLKS